MTIKLKNYTGNVVLIILNTHIHFSPMIFLVRFLFNRKATELTIGQFTKFKKMFNEFHCGAYDDRMWLSFHSIFQRVSCVHYSYVWLKMMNIFQENFVQLENAFDQLETPTHKCLTIFFTWTYYMIVWFQAYSILLTNLSAFPLRNIKFCLIFELLTQQVNVERITDEKTHTQ